MFKVVLLIFMFFFFIGCSSKNQTLQFSSTQISYDDIQKNSQTQLPLIEHDIDKIIMELQKNKLTSQTCSNYIDERANYILYAGEKEYLQKNQLEFIEKRAYYIVKKLFNMRLLLRERLVAFSQTSKVSKQCLSSFRKAFRYSRFLEEFVTEMAVSVYPNRAKAEAYDFTTNAYQFYLNPKYKSFELKTGDVLLLRPANFISATIARIGDDDGQFSHGAVVYITRDNEIMIMESLISKGLVFVPYEEWRKKNYDARIVQFRLYDAQKAEVLTQDFYERNKLNYNNKSIIYDFQMDDKTEEELFCTEVIYHAFKDAGIPSYKTSFHQFNNHPFLKNLTIETSSAFSPSDIEVETKFELISEWRNYDLTSKARMQDAILTSILRWMSEEDYRLKTTFKSFTLSPLAYYGRQWFGLMSNQIPENMPYGFLKTVVKLEDVKDVLEEYLVQLNVQHLKEYNYPMTYLKMIEALEAFKKEDYQRFTQREKEKVNHLNNGILTTEYRSKSPLFHQLFSR